MPGSPPGIYINRFHILRTRHRLSSPHFRCKSVLVHIAAFHLIFCPATWCIVLFVLIYINTRALWTQKDVTNFYLMHTMQSCTGPVQGQNRVFPVKFSTQGKTFLFSLQGPLFSLQGFPCETNFTGKTLFLLQGRVCSVQLQQIPTSKMPLFAVCLCRHLKSWLRRF